MSSSTGKSSRVPGEDGAGREDPPSPPEGIRIRRARPGDLTAVARVEAASFSMPWSPSAFRSLLDREGVLFLVAEVPEASSPDGAEGEPRLLGHGVLWRAGSEGELSNLAVAPEARGRGLAGALLDRILHDAARAGVRTVFLEVRRSNEAAVGLYRSRGFRQVGVRENYYERPREDARVLRAELRKTTPEPES